MQKLFLLHERNHYIVVAKITFSFKLWQEKTVLLKSIYNSSCNFKLA